MNRKQNVKRLSRNNDGIIEPKKGSNLDHNASKSSIGTYPREIKLLPLELRPILDQEDKRKEEIFNVGIANVCSNNCCSKWENRTKIPRIPRKLRASGNVSCCSKVRHFKCSNTSDVYRNILGPTADESILAGLQTVIDICGLIDCCHSDSELSTSISSECEGINEAPYPADYSAVEYDNAPYGTIIESYAVHETKELSAKEDENLETVINNFSTAVEETYATASSKPSREEIYHSAQASSLSGNNTTFNTPNSSFVASPSSRSPTQDATFHSAQARSPTRNNTTFEDANSSFAASPSSKSESRDATYLIAEASSPTSPSGTFSTPKSLPVRSYARQSKSREERMPAQKSSKTRKSHHTIPKDVSFAYPPVTSTPLSSPTQSSKEPLAPSASPIKQGSPTNLPDSISQENVVKPVAESLSVSMTRDDQTPVYAVSSESWCRIDECCGTTADNIPCVKVKAKDGRDICIKYRCRSVASSLSAKCFPPVEIPPCDNTNCRRYYGLEKGVETDDYVSDLESPYNKFSDCSPSETTTATTSSTQYTPDTDQESSAKKRRACCWKPHSDHTSEGKTDSKPVVIQDPKAGISLVFDPRYTCNPYYRPSSKVPKDFRKLRTIPPAVQPVVGVCTEETCTRVGDVGGERLMEVRYALVRISVFPNYTTYEIMKSSKKKPKKVPDTVEGIFVTKR
ncbi:hypothetical protein Trydic_g7677 [Trypoxylus dichotomus]